MLESSFAKAFAVWVSPDKGWALIRDMEYKHKPQLIEHQQLEDKVKVLEAALAKRQTDNTDTLLKTAQNQHDTLQLWIKLGYITGDQIITTRWHYNLTETGKSKGFTQNKNGTIIPPKD